MTKQKGISKKRIVIPISGEVLTAVMEMRAIVERERGIPTSLTAIVKASIMAQRKEAAKIGKNSVETTVLAIEQYERELREREL